MHECPHCRTPCDLEDQFCNQCGAHLKELETLGQGQTRKALSLSDVQYNLGLVYYKKGEYDKALQCWEKGLRQSPDSTFLQERVAELKREMGDA